MATASGRGRRIRNICLSGHLLERILIIELWQLSFVNVSSVHWIHFLHGMPRKIALWDNWYVCSQWDMLIGNLFSEFGDGVSRHARSELSQARLHLAAQAASQEPLTL